MTSSQLTTDDAGRLMSPQHLSHLLGLPEPTEQQAEVIAHQLSPLLVVAGAGSGKTATMSQRVVYLVATGQVRPDQVVGLTFTRKAAAELAERITTQLHALAMKGIRADLADCPPPTVATYNSFAGEIVREYGLQQGIDPDATLITEARAWQIVTSIVESHRGSLTADNLTQAVTTVLDLDNALCENLLDIAHVRQEMTLLCEHFDALRTVKKATTVFRDPAQRMRLRVELLDLVEEYRQYKQQHALLTFGDQISYAHRILTHPGCETVIAALRERYHAILLDEFQDTSVAQVQMLAAPFRGCGVTAVGDPHQAIYGWRGASAGALGLFRDEFAVCSPAPGADTERETGAQPHVVPVLALSTAWRNDLHVLEAANVISGPLRHHQPVDGDSTFTPVPVRELQPRPGCTQDDNGIVWGTYCQDPIEEAQTVADFLAERWTPQTTLAVLSRARAPLTLVADALEERGLPYEIVGIGGMLTHPDVVDLRALLTVATQPQRGDWLMRLLTGANLGAKDIASLNAWAREHACRNHDDSDSHQMPAHSSQGAMSNHAIRADSAALADEDDPALQRLRVDDLLTPMLSEAIDTLVRLADEHPRGIAGIHVDNMSERGLRAVDHLGRQLRRCRAIVHLPVPDVVAMAEQILGLDIDVAARHSARADRHALNAFAQVALQHANDVDHPTVATFLDWLDAADKRERSLPIPEVDTEPGAVQLMTIHASKGLEWDHVAVIGMSEGKFPNYSSKPSPDLTVKHKSWLTDRSEFPHPLRLDHDVLPPFPLGECDPEALDSTQLKDMMDSYVRALGRQLVAEERRLAYVAITRARHEVLLSGSHFSRQAKDPAPMSRFLAELRRRDLLTAYGPGWTHLDEERGNTYRTRSRALAWPPSESFDDDRSLEASRHRAFLAGIDQVVTALDALQSDSAPHTALATDSSSVHETESDPVVAQWREHARLLLAERNRAHSATSVHLPHHLAATQLDALRRDPQRFALSLRRPLPPAPSPSARLGTLFHDAIAQRLAQQGSLLSLEEAGVPDTLSEADRRTVERWLTTAQSLPILDDYVLYDTEIDRELTVGSTTLRCRIDAVFRRNDSDHEDPGAWLIVDWKTGRHRVPVDQLSVYVHLWARIHHLDPQAIRAAYLYVDYPQGRVDELTPDNLLSWEDLSCGLNV